MTRIRALAFAALIAFASSASAQQGILQGGPWQPGHLGIYGISQGQPVLLDAGPAQGGGIGTGISELALTARGTGTAPYVGQGTGAFGSIGCLYDAPITNPTGYHFLCFSPNASTATGLISFGAMGVASPIALNWNINGTSIVPVSCSGTPSSSFAVINGIVTHC